VSAGIDIDVEGVEQLRRSLDRLEPEARRELDRELRRAARDVAREAGETVRARAVTRSRNPRRTADGYVVRVREGRRRRTGGLRGVGTTVGASMLEWAGREGTRSERGRTLKATLDARYGAPGRVLWKAWDRRREQTEAAIREAVARAERRLSAIVGG
jgi:hypothetical protein